MTFRAFRISQTDGKISGAIADATLDELTPGDIVIKAAYRASNDKDALAATGAAKILMPTSDEVAAVKRVAVVLQSGVRAWAYVDARY